MAVIAGFQIATAPNQPQATGVVVTSRGQVSTYQTGQQVLSVNSLIRPPDPGASYAY